MSKYIQNITKNYNKIFAYEPNSNCLHIKILKNKIKILYLRINAKKKKNVNSKNHKEEIVVRMKIDRAASSAIIVWKKLFP